MWLTISIRKILSGALIRLGRVSGLFPTCLFLKNIKLQSEDPVAGGRYGDVFKVDCAGLAIAIKVPRVYQKSDVTALLKVDILF